MKKYFLLAVMAISLGVINTSAQITLPAPSTTQTIVQDFGLGRITLTYSRPGIKGRKSFAANSELAPLGKPWRTGANSATRIRFTDKVSVGGTALDSGTYVIYTVPNKGQWDVVFSKGTAYPGAEGFKESDDVVRYKASSTTVKDNIETFTMQLSNVTNETCELNIMWANTLVKVPIATNIKDRLRTQFETALQGANKPYQQAATFYYEWEKDYNKALQNINKAIEGNPKAYYMYLTKARIQKDMGDKSGAKATATKTVELATEAKNDDYVRMAKELMGKM